MPSRPLTTSQRCRHWMKAVLQPLNEKAAKIVTEHADLLEGDSVEPLLLQLVAHVSAYRVILERYLYAPALLVTGCSSPQVSSQCFKSRYVSVCLK